MHKNQRNIYCGGLYHIYNRGIDKKVIFASDIDFEYFLDKLRFYSYKTGINIIAYCLLPNHYHFVLQEPNPGLPNGQPRVGVNQYRGSVISKFIGLLAHSYTRYFNDKYKRSGRLFEYIYKSREINIEKQLGVITNYVYFNCVKHKLSNTPEEYKYTFLDQKNMVF